MSGSDKHKEIERINLQLLGLLNERARLLSDARQAGELGDMLAPKERRDLLTSLLEANEGPLSDDDVRALFGEIFKLDLEGPKRQRQTLQIRRSDGEGDRVYVVNGHEIGREPVYIAGPCAIESEEQLDSVAAVLAREGVKFLRGGAFKPRTSPYEFQGLGKRGLEILRDVSQRHGLATVTEVLDPRMVEITAEHADVLQVGTRSMYNYPLLQELGKAGRPVFLKRGISATLDELLAAAEYIVKAGNSELIFCERGIRTFVQETRFTLDIASVPLLRKMTACPVVVDVSHAAGRTDILPELIAAAFAVGASGVMVEVHPNPPAARSDSEQQLTPEEFAQLKRRLDERGV